MEGKLQSRSIQGRRHEVLVPKMLELAVLLGYKFAGSSGLPNPFHGCVEVKLDSHDYSVAEVGSIKGPVQLVEVNETSQSQKT